MLKAIVLAAGLSRRMGAANKLLLPFRGKTVLENVFYQLLASGAAGEIWVVVGHEAERARALLSGLPVQIVDNPGFASGMTSSIQAGIRAAAAGTTGFLICLSDMPLLESEDYRRLADFFENALRDDPQAIVQPVFGGQRGHPVCFSAFYKTEILENTEPEGCRPVIQRHKNHLRTLEMPNANCLADLDTPKDFEELKI